MRRRRQGVTSNPTRSSKPYTLQRMAQPPPLSLPLTSPLCHTGLGISLISDIGDSAKDRRRATGIALERHLHAHAIMRIYEHITLSQMVRAVTCAQPRSTRTRTRTCTLDTYSVGPNRPICRAPAPVYARRQREHEARGAPHRWGRNLHERWRPSERTRRAASAFADGRTKRRCYYARTYRSERPGGAKLAAPARGCARQARRRISPRRPRARPERRPRRTAAGRRSRSARAPARRNTCARRVVSTSQRGKRHVRVVPAPLQPTSSSSNDVF